MFLKLGLKTFFKCLVGWSRSTKSEKKGLGFSILHDTEENKSVCHLPDQDQAVWKAPPMESVMTKENVNIPGKWTGENVRLLQN